MDTVFLKVLNRKEKICALQRGYVALFICPESSRKLPKVATPESNRSKNWVRSVVNHESSEPPPPERRPRKVKISPYYKCVVIKCKV